MSVFKPTLLAAAVALCAQGAFAAPHAEQEHLNTIQQQHSEQMTERLAALRAQAQAGTNVIVKNGKRYQVINGVEYRLTADNGIIFDMPTPDFYNETAMRNIFDFFNSDWELTWYDGGMVAVNKLFGNYDYGNGCLTEYYPNGIIANGEKVNVLSEIATCSVNSFDTTIENVDIGYEITAAELGLDGNAITAVERYKDKLYVSQDGNPARVVVVDIATRAVVDEITPANGLAAYNEISELYIRDNQLYVVPRFSHRVDIFDLDNQHQHITTIGTGKDSGTNSLHRSQAVVANDTHVFVADALDTIKVYKQSDVTPENNLAVPRQGLLQFEGKYSHRFVQMHQIGDYLIAHTAGKNYYIYDLRKLDAALEQGVALAADKIVADNSLQKIDLDGEQLVVNFKNRIEWYNINDFIAQDFTFGQPNFTASQLNGQAVGALKDLHSVDGKFVTANANGLSFNELLREEINFAADAQVETAQIKFDQLMPASVGYIFDKDEAYEVLTDRTKRSVLINSLVKTELLDNHTVRITNYAAKELRDLNIESKVNGINKAFILAKIDRLPAYAQITLPLSDLGDSYRFNSAIGDGVFDLSVLFNDRIDLPAQFSHRFSSNSDPFAQKLARLMPSWEVRFATNNPLDTKWRPMNALYAKEWLIMLTNFAYMLSSPEYKHVWFNFKGLLGYDMFAGGGNAFVPNGIFSAEDYTHYYNSVMKRPFVNVGITSMGGGLGSSGITGVDTFNFVSHYYGSWGIIAHEFGHGFDGKSYGHNTAFAMGGAGFQPLMTGFGRYFVRKGDLPYMDDDLNGFYKPENDQYRYNSVSQGARKYRDDSHMDVVDHYFMQFSSMPQSWVANGSGFVVEQLDSMTNQEKILMGNISKLTDKRNLCRFEFTDGEQYYGYVEQVENGLRCEAGEFMQYRQADGDFVSLHSKTNQFDWLSLHKKGQMGQPVLHQNGQPLCYLNNSSVYGIGFLNESSQCTQLDNVYHSNGNRWTFSSKWGKINYLSGDFVVPNANAISDFVLDNLPANYVVIEGQAQLNLTVSTQNPVQMTATLRRDGTAFGSVTAKIDGDGQLLLAAQNVAAGEYELLLEGMADGGKQGAQQVLPITLIDASAAGDGTQEDPMGVTTEVAPLPPVADGTQEDQMGVAPEVGDEAGNGEASYPAYAAGSAYSAGDRVSHAGGNYECKPWPYEGWCGGSSAHYAPGTGSSWSDAWLAL
ncbi:MAG: hypothetical protein ACRCYV_00295 [Aeromonas sp.]